MITTSDILEFFKKNEEKEFTSKDINKKFKFEGHNGTQKLLRLYQQNYLTRELRLIDGYKRFLYKYKK